MTVAEVLIISDSDYLKGLCYCRHWIYFGLIINGAELTVSSRLLSDHDGLHG